MTNTMEELARKLFGDGYVKKVILHYQELHEIRCPYGCQESPIRWVKQPYLFPRRYTGKCCCSKYELTVNDCTVIEIDIPEPLLTVGTTKRSGNKIFGINGVNFHISKGWVYSATDISTGEKTELREPTILGPDGYKQRLDNLKIRKKDMPYLETLNMFTDWKLGSSRRPRVYYRHDLVLNKAYSMVVKDFVMTIKTLTD